MRLYKKGTPRLKVGRGGSQSPAFSCYHMRLSAAAVSRAWEGKGEGDARDASLRKKPSPVEGGLGGTAIKLRIPTWAPARGAPTKHAFCRDTPCGYPCYETRLL
jgi:hypothetical protein